MQLRDTLEDTGHWGTARVVPTTRQFLRPHGGRQDRRVERRRTSSSRSRRATRPARCGSTKKEYEGRADTRVYRDNYTVGRDPFENVYVAIANDLLAARNAQDRRRAREHPPRERAALRRRLRAGRVPRVPRAEQEDRRVQGAAPAGRGRRAGQAHRPDPRARLRHDRHGQRELRGVQRAPRGAVHELAPLHVRRDHRRGEAEGPGAQPHDPGRRRHRRGGLRSGQLLQQQLRPRRGRRALRRHRGRRRRRRSAATRSARKRRSTPSRSRKSPARSRPRPRRWSWTSRGARCA